MSRDPYANLPQVPAFTVTSTDLQEDEKLAMPQVSGSFGAGGQDRSPQLSWSGFPPETRSFAVTMFDPDAPTVSCLWHWAVVSIPSTVTHLPTNAGDESGSALPHGAVQLPNDVRVARYIGAAPPDGHGKHRYIFAIHALNAETLEIDAQATPAFLMFNLLDTTLARAFLTGWYER